VKRKHNLVEKLHHLPSLRETLGRLYKEGRIDKEKKDYIETHIEKWVKDSKYILFNLGVHMAMGFVRFTVIPIPLPIGSTLRALWVMGNRMHCNLIWNMERKRIHSLVVLGIAIIPFLGYFAYTIPLKKKSEYLSYLYAEHISFMLYDKALEEKLKKVPAFIKKLAYIMLVPKELR